MSRQGGLGRGLAALIPAGEEGPRLRELPVDAISPNPHQPREGFDEETLRELAESIRDVGLLQPVVVRPVGPDRYELVAGERRVRAARMAGLAHIPAVIRDTAEADRLKEALIENIHRVQLNPLEEAAAYRQLLDDFDITQEELARRLGKSRPVISNALRLLALPPAVQRRVAAGVLSGGHARAVLALDDPEEMERVAGRIVAEGLSVRDAEELVRARTLEGGSHSGRRRPTRRARAPGLEDLEAELSDLLRARVRIQMGARKGRVQIDVASVDDLERVVGVLARGLEGEDDQAP